jgi:hypothetical protein
MQYREEAGSMAASGGVPPTSADPPPSGAGAVDKFLSLPSDPAGSQTFARFRWQAKIAVLRWLGTLAKDDAPEAVVCERVDDVVLVYRARYVFEQLKTKDRGSWSTAKVCAPKGGLDALIRSWNAARAAGLDRVSTFELRLEGPMSAVRATVSFFEDPTTASAGVRKALVELGLPRKDVGAFLSRLSIHPNTTPRGAIDAVLQQSVGALWPSMTHVQAGLLVERLLEAAEAAQADERPSITVLQHLRAAASPDDADGGTKNERLRPVLSREDLRALTPPLPDEPNDVLLQRLGQGQPSSALELKLKRAGARVSTVQHAQRLRAEAEIRRQLVLAAGGGAVDALDDLGRNVLMVADGAAAGVALRMTDPLVAASPAEHVFNHFLSNPAALASVDVQNVLGPDPLMLLGLLCQLSDECRFGWRP